jgi:hypothetical protein
VLVNAAGPVQEYMPPVTAAVVRFIEPPEQSGVLLPGVGVAGVGFTITEVVAVVLVHPPTVTVRLYVPLIATVEAGSVGFCVVDVNADGPVQE